MRAGVGGVVLVVLALLAAGCGAGEDSPGPAPTTAGRTADPTAALRERCLSAMPEDADLEALGLAGATGGDLEAARIGPATSSDVAVLLPQTSGICGWGRWATAAADAGVTSVLVNPCGYGESTCTPEEDADPRNEVDAALALARDEIGADRVVLLGTSMGGSLTVMAVAAGADVDAWADVSGPAAWDGVDLVSLAGSLPPDGLVVMAPSDGPQQYDAAEALADAAGVPFVRGRSGHGWELLVDPVSGQVTRIGRRLIGLATGS
ncbi:alpha/beta hydrolase [Nocardioides KLBMP 9356]|uniref:Alpha/beta hydrolase n=1 Tax=Nocardioides potassii TaxID=2911371 RepID=A0ABS9HCT0_9ACTN|nr:alpha/beta hydrolase [Nocardioides potassii]MCF6378956.1 alpha/beta hydrolase [Nocardioides potassii]